MNKLTILLGCLCFTPGMIGLSNANPAWENITGETQLNPGQQIFDKTPFIRELVELNAEQKRRFDKEVYEFIFGNDLLTNSSFKTGEGEKYTGNPNFVDKINEFHSYTTYHHIYDNEAEDQDVRAAHWDKVKSYLKMLVNVHLNRLRVDNDNKTGDEKLWIFKDEARHAKNIENMIEVATDIIVNNGQGYKYKRSDFSDKAKRVGYACQTVLRQMFENIRSEYNDCANELDGQIDRVIGERDVAKATPRNKNKTDGDSFLDFETLNNWLFLTQKEYNGYCFAYRNQGLPSEYSYENAFNDYNGKNIVGSELLRCCVIGLEETLKQELKKAKESNNNENLDENALLKITGVNGNEIEVTVKSARDIKNRIANYRDLKRKSIRTQNAFNKISSIKKVMEENQKNKNVLEGGHNNNLLPNRNNNTLPTSEEILSQIDVQYQQIIEDTISAVIDYVVKKNEDDTSFDISETTSLFSNIIDTLKKIPETLDHNDKLKTRLATTDNGSDNNRVNEFKNAINKITGQQKAVLMPLIIKLLEESYKFYQDEILKFMNSCVCTQTEESLFGNNKKLHAEIKRQYSTLVYNVEAYMTDLGFIDTRSEINPAVNPIIINNDIQHIQQVPTAKDLANMINNGANGGCSSPSDGDGNNPDGMHFSVFNNNNIDQEHVQTLVTRNINMAITQQELMKMLTQDIKPKPDSQNRVMIPGVMRKTGVMFCNLTDSLASLNKQATSYNLKNTIVFSGNIVSSEYKKCQQDTNETMTLCGSRIDQMLNKKRQELFAAQANSNQSRESEIEAEIEELQELKKLYSDARNSNSQKDKMAAVMEQKNALQTKKIFDIGKGLYSAVKKLTGNEQQAKIATSSILWNTGSEENTQNFINFLSAGENKNPLLALAKNDDETNKIKQYCDSNLKLLEEKAKIQEELENLSRQNAELQRLNNSLQEKQEKLNNIENNNGNNEEKRRLAQENEDLKQKIAMLERENKDKKKNLEENIQKIDEQENELQEDHKALQERLKATIPPPPPAPITVPKDVNVARPNKKANTGAQNKKTQVAKPELSFEQQLLHSRNNLKGISNQKLEYANKDGVKVTISKDNAQEQANSINNEITELKRDKNNNKERIIALNNILKQIDTMFHIKPKVNDQNFLQAALSKAIRDRRANLHMHDDENEDEEEEDDWD